MLPLWIIVFFYVFLYDPWIFFSIVVRSWDQHVLQVLRMSLMIVLSEGPQPQSSGIGAAASALRPGIVRACPRSQLQSGALTNHWHTWPND